MKPPKPPEFVAAFDTDRPSEPAAEVPAVTDAYAATPEELAKLRGIDLPLARSLVALRASTVIDREMPRTESRPLQQLILPLFDTAHAVPNALVRSALFPALHYGDGPRPFLKNATIYAVGSLSVKFTGQQFDQSDFDVFLAVLDIGAPTAVGSAFTFTAQAILRSLGRSTGGKDHEWLHAVLVRLRGGTIEIREKDKGRYFDGLIQGGVQDEPTKVYRIIINPNFAQLFGFGSWTKIDRQQRAVLGRNGTAKVLHGYYSSHAAPDLHRYETLAGIAGIANKNKRQLRKTLETAHDRLKAPACGFLRDYEATEIGIKIEKNETPSQRRHLEKKVTAKQPRRRKPKTTG